MAVRLWPKSSCSSREQPTVRADRGRAGEDDGGERGGEEYVHLALHVGVDALDLEGHLLFAFVVLDEQPGPRGGERGLPRDERHPDLGARLVLAALARHREHAVDRVPELRDRFAEELALPGAAAVHRQRLLAPQRVGQIQPDALELRGPRGERIAFVGVDHVAHRERGKVQVVLDAEQLQRVLAASLGQIGLERPQPADLVRDVPRVRQDGSKGDEQADHETDRGGPARWARLRLHIVR
jgi:hypothetical protein